MAESSFGGAYNPDVLSCLANLSSDEVFTPPDVANKMLDMLPQGLFHDPNTTFLDPACKTGVFLREIAKRLISGLEPQIPDLQERINHVFHRQLFAIGITELTSLLSRRSVYCSKYPDSEFSVTQFDDAEGNIRYRNTRHTWIDGKCKYCGISRNTVLGDKARGQTLEAHAYEWIHALKPEEIFNMRFDVIISNPPYQLSDGGNSASAKPIYQLFVNQAKKLMPRYMTMIIPSRWFSGGKGLDDFRAEMIADRRIRSLDDFLNASDCFGNGVEVKGGVCYFLWDRDHSGPCRVTTHSAEGILSSTDRYMKIGDNDVFIRRNEAISILEKVSAKGETTFAQLVSSRKPFGLPTNVSGRKTRRDGDVTIYLRGGKAFMSRATIERNPEWIDKYKIFITKAYNAGDDYPHQILNKPIFGDRGTCCSETYVLIGPFRDAETTNNAISYIHTKFFRFLVSVRKISQDATQKVYSFVPIQDFSKPWTDEDLYAKYGLEDKEISFIEGMIKPMGEEEDRDAD